MKPTSKVEQIFCPECGQAGKIFDGRATTGGFRRRYECRNFHRWATLERTEITRKSDGKKPVQFGLRTPKGRLIECTLASEARTAWERSFEYLHWLMREQDDTYARKQRRMRKQGWRIARFDLVEYFPTRCAK